MELAIRISITAFVLVALYWLWTAPLDVPGFFAKIFPIPTKKAIGLDFEIEQVTGALFSGHPCLLFYIIHFVNTSGENVTVKEIGLRYADANRSQTLMSTVITTGEVENPKGEKFETLLVEVPRAGDPVRDYLFMQNWKNIRPTIGENKTLAPGAVLAGSAAFVFVGLTIDKFKKLRSIELVAADFSKNEATKTIVLEPVWIEQMEKDWRVIDRAFTNKGETTPIVWK